MRKILLSVFIFLLVILVFFTLKDGIVIGNLEILSISQISKKNDTIDAKLQQTNKLITVDYVEKNKTLKKDATSATQTKLDWQSKINESTDEEILKATTKESYEIPFLLTIIGNHATKQGVNIKMEVMSNGSTETSNLRFTVDGIYVGISNFISEIANDTKLNFRPQKFTLLPNNGDILRATFVIENIKIDEKTMIKNSTSISNDDSTQSTNQITENTKDTEQTKTSTNTTKD